MSNYIITGANSEIGNALAHHLDKKGHTLLLVSRSEKKDASLQKHEWISGIDMTKEEDLAKLQQQIACKFKSQFSLIHSVGDFWKHKSITNTSFEEVHRQILSHYVTLFGMIKIVIPHMQSVGGGKIIAFSCNSVKYNYPDMAAFTSSKAAIECLVKCTANEVSKHNICINALALPSIKTNSVIATKPEEFHKDYVNLYELTECIERTIENLSPLINGNTINIFKYSESFYHKGYYERNIIWEE